jgi:hypothetical protein
MRSRIVCIAVCAVLFGASLAQAAKVIVYDGKLGDADPRSQGVNLEVPDGTLVVGANPAGFTPDAANDFVHIDSSTNSDFAYQIPLGGAISAALAPIVANDRYTIEMEFQAGSSTDFTKTWLFDFISGTTTGSLGFRDRFILETNLDQPGGPPGPGPDRIRMATSGITATLFGDPFFEVGDTPNFTSLHDMNTLRLERIDSGFKVFINDDLQYEAVGNQSGIGLLQLEIKDADADTLTDLNWKSLSVEDAIPEPPLPPSPSIQFVREHPFVVSGLTDTTPLSSADVNTYANTWNASTADVYSDSSDHILNRWEPQGVPWTKWVTPGSEGANGVFSGFELGVNQFLPAGLPNRYGYHIGGEPNTQEESDEVIATAAALKQYDPGAFVYVGLNTDATDAMEDQMMSDPNIDGVIGHRYHSNNTSYANLEHTRALGRQHNKPYFRFLRSFHTSVSTTESYDLTESDYRFKAFSSLTYGYTGIQWFIYNLKDFHDLDPQLFTTRETYQFSDRKSPAFEQVAALNQELFYIGEQTKHLRSTDVRLHLGDNAPYGQPTGTVDWSVGAGSDPYITSIDQFANNDMDILIGFFDHYDTQDLYFMVQNTRHTHGDNPAVLLPGVVEIAFDFSSVVDPLFDKTNIEQVSRLTGLWETVSLTSLGGDLYSLEFLLLGGDADLFRYSISDLPGDFDGDGVVDGFDFLQWQRGESPDPLSQSDLAIWEANYGTVASLIAATASTAVPEPTTGVMVLLGICCITSPHRIQGVLVA